MASSPAQRLVAGVTIGEAIGESPYGALHRASTASRRDLTALLVAPALAADAAFRATLLDSARTAKLCSLEHPNLVTTVAVNAQDGALTVVSLGARGATTVVELLAAGRGKGVRPPPEVAAAVARALVRGLASLHGRGLVHGAVHPRSIMLGADGIRLGDVAVGAALGAAIAEGADAALWRDLRGYVAGELMIGEAPSAPSDVFAAGAVVFALLTGEAPPGTLRTGPALERVINRALDTDVDRRYRTAAELSDELLEAFDDDRWSFASDAEVLAAAGGERALTEGGLDDATEDLLASLGDAVRNRPMRPSVDLRVEAAAARQASKPSSSGGLDALLADLDDPREEMTQVEQIALLDRDPVSELISIDAVKRAHLEAAARKPAAAPAAPPPKARAATPAPVRPPSEFEDESTPLPKPLVAESGLIPMAAIAASRPASALPRAATPRPVRAATPAPTPEVAHEDAAAAMDAIAGLDEPPPPRARSPQGPPPRAPSPAAPARAPSPAVPARASSSSHSPSAATPTDADAAPAESPPPPRKVVAAFDEAAFAASYEPPRLRSRMGPVYLVLAAGLVGVLVWAIVHQRADSEAAARERAKKQADADALSAKLNAELADPGGIRITSNPDNAAVWLQLGRTPLDSMTVSTGMLQQLRVDLDGFAAQDVAVLARDWTGPGDKQVAKLAVTLAPPVADAVALPALPPKPADAGAAAFAPGNGIFHVESTPSGAAVWLLVGVTNSMELKGIEAGRDYDLRVTKDGYVPGYVHIGAEEWRDGGDPRTPLAAAPKKAVMDRAVELVPAPKDPGGKRKPKAH